MAQNADPNPDPAPSAAGADQAAAAALEGPSKRRNKRAATKDALLQAFERVLVRDGVHGLGVNGVVREAQVSKELLYRYFGGLEGLAEAWEEGAGAWPDADEVMGGSREAYHALSRHEQLKTGLSNYYVALRRRPIARQLLLDELVKQSSLTVFFGKMRASYGEKFETRQGRAADQRPEMAGLNVLLLAAVNYLVLRSQTAPTFFGIDLASDAGDAKVAELIGTLIDLVEAGLEARAAPGAGSTRSSAAPDA